MILRKIITPLITLGLILSFSPTMAGHLPNHGSDHKPLTNKTKNKILEGHKKHEKKLKNAFRTYKKKVAKVWGKEAVIPDSKRDVTYRNNFKQRSIVNYDKGVVKVELALKPSIAKNASTSRRKLVSAVKKAINQSADERSIIDIAKNPTPPNNMRPAVLAGLVANVDESPLSPEELTQFAQAIAAAMKTHKVTGKDGKERVVVSTEFKLVPDHIRIRAEKFSKSVNNYAQEHDIPAPLVYAVIETESAFNPRAKSSTPAFGLMQLVPRSGARDAYKFLYSKDKILKERYLYDPDNNIQLGTAYLHLLYYKRFKKINDPEARKLATIAAYNAGSDSVIRSFTGRFTKRNYPSRYSWRRHAIKKINKLSAEDLYKHLRRFLPAKETRNYLKRVRTRMAKYSS